MDRDGHHRMVRFELSFNRFLKTRIFQQHATVACMPRSRRIDTVCEGLYTQASMKKHRAHNTFPGSKKSPHLPNSHTKRARLPPTTAAEKLITLDLPTHARPRRPRPLLAQPSPTGSCHPASAPPLRRRPSSGVAQPRDGRPLRWRRR